MTWQVLGEVSAGSTCTFSPDGDCTWLVNHGDQPADVLLLTGELHTTHHLTPLPVLLLTSYFLYLPHVAGEPLQEPVALGGPIVMNTERELKQAYAELRAGTFLDV